MTNQDLLAVMEKYPDLTYYGFWEFRGTSYYNRIKTSMANVFAEKEKWRQELRESSLEVLTAVEALFANVGKTKTITHSGSYGLKHVAEDLLGDLGNYVSNGELIAVMLHLGFKHRLNGPNAWFNAAEKDLKVLRKRREEAKHKHYASYNTNVDELYKLTGISRLDRFEELLEWTRGHGYDGAFFRDDVIAEQLTNNERITPLCREVLNVVKEMTF
jgi:hypothetical protein